MTSYFLRGDIINSRLKQIRHTLNLSQEEFASKIGIKSRSHISSLENGVRTVTDRIIRDLVNVFNVNEEWLRTGIGNMFTEPDIFSLDEYAKQRGCSELQIELVKSLLDLNTDTIQELINVFKPVYNKLAEEEATATLETTTNHLCITEETENYRKELEATQKGITSSALEIGKEKIS